MNKHRFNFALPIISAIGLPISSIAYSANPLSAIDVLNYKLQEINKLQLKLDRQLDESRARQIQIEQQRQLEIQNAELSGQVKALQQQVKELKQSELIEQQVQELQQKVDEFKSEQGVIEMKAVNTRPLTDTSKCEYGTDNERGELNGRVNFTKKFSIAPNVHAALKLINVVGDNRIFFDVLLVDSQGFNYKFNTACKTAVHQASVSWIAVTP